MTSPLRPPTRWQQGALGLTTPVGRIRVDELRDLAGDVGECPTAVAGDLPEEVLRLDGVVLSDRESIFEPRMHCSTFPAVGASLDPLTFPGFQLMTPAAHAGESVSFVFADGRALDGCSYRSLCCCEDTTSTTNNGGCPRSTAGCTGQTVG